MALKPRLKQNALFAWLRENGILIASGGRKNVPFQQYINAGYFTVKEVVLDDEDGYQIRLTPQLTGKGQQLSLIHIYGAFQNTKTAIAKIT